ncbi:MAG: hypothetical protein JWO38_5736 [Gemmataceae bacterium]|nr:hypothetical protein [Gemmataceae bacterium]
MWSSLTLAAALSLGPAQPGGIQLTNVRMTIGELGPTRPNSKLLPGDVLFIGYDIDGLAIDPDGTARYTMAMEVTDAAGKLIFKQDPRELTDFIPLRGNKLPARAFVTVGLDQPPGAYVCKLSVTDPKTKAVTSLTVKFEVLKAEFGIVAVFTSHDARGELSAPTTGLVGQSIFVQFAVASFQRDAKTKQPNIEFLFEVFDDKGQPTLGVPKKHIQDSGVEADKGAFPLYFPLYMSRPGKFTVRVTATDKIANKKSTYELPVTILPGN